MKRITRRSVLAAAGLAAALVAGGCGIVIEDQSGEQRDVIGDVAITTAQCVDGSIFPVGEIVLGRGSEAICRDEDAVITPQQADRLERAAARGEAPHDDYQLLLGYEVPNGAQPPASFPFAETGVDEEDTPQTGEYRASSSYAAELEAEFPSGADTFWAAYVSTPVKGYWGASPRWSSTAPFGLAGVVAGEPFRGPFATGTVVGSRVLSGEGDEDAPVDCEEGLTDCWDDSDGIAESEADRRRGARALSGAATKVATRDLAVAPAGDVVTIPAGQTGEIPFVLRYAGKAEPTFQLSGNATIAGATVTPVPGTFTPADDGQAVVKVGVTVPAGTPAGPQNVELVATLPNGQRRSGGTQFHVGPAATSPLIVASASKRACVSKRSFKIRLRQTKRDPLVSATVTVNGKRVKTVNGRRITAPVNLTGLAKGRFTVKITAKTRSGKTKTGVRRYRTCVPKRQGGIPKL